MKKTLRQNKGITLVALVITIIILLILAGITINLLTESGLFEKAQLAKQESENAQLKENETLDDYRNTIDEYVNGTREKITVDKEEYEELKRDVAKLKETLLEKQSVSPNYTEKVDLLGYSSSTNQYTAPSSGYIIVPSLPLNSRASLQLYIDGEKVSYLGNNLSDWIRFSVCLPISENSKVYYTASSTNTSVIQLSEIYFVPND